MALRTVGVELIAKVQGYRAGMASAIDATKQMGIELEQLGKQSPAKLHDIEMAAGAAGLALVGLAGWAVKSALEFDKQMSEVGAVSDATAGEMDQLRKSALAAGKATVFSATEAAKAEAELAKAGISTSDILGGALTGSLDLAAAGSLDLADAAEVAAKAMNIFKLNGGQVTHIADVLAAGANKSATDVHDLGEALKMGGLAAHNAGLSLEDTVGVLSAFADSALNGSDAGTSLKTMLQFLANPTKKARDLMEELGIEVYDANGNLKDISTIAGILQTKLAGLTQQQRQQAFATIFGSDATRAATVLYENGEQGIRDYIAAVNDQGAAERMAAEKTDNLAGDIERLKGSIETLSIESGEGANTGLRSIVQALDHMVSAFSGLPGGVQASIVILAGVTGGALLAAAAFLKVRSKVGELAEAMREAGPVTGRFGAGLQQTTILVGKLGAALGVLQVASAAYATATESAPAVTADFADRLSELAAKGGDAGDAIEHLGYDLGTLNSGALAGTERGIAGTVEGLTGLGAVFDESLQHARERLDQLDQALAYMVSSGHAADAQKVFAMIAEEAHKQGVSVTELSKGLPLYTAAMNQASKETADGAAASASAADKTNELTQAVADANDELSNLKELFDQLNGRMLDWREANRDAEAAVDDLKTALDESNGSLSVHDEKGRAAAAAVDTLAKKAAEAAQAKLDETGSIEEANKVYQHYIDKLKDTLRQAGLSKKEIDKLVDSIAAMPDTKTVNIQVNVQALIDQLRSVLGHVGDFVHWRWGGIQAMAGGGTVGAGIATSPTVLFGERETGGEAYIPRLGDYSRSMATLAQAAAWYGASVVPGGGGPRTALLNYKIVLNAKVLHEALVQYALDTNRAPSGLWPTQIRVTS